MARLSKDVIEHGRTVLLENDYRAVVAGVMRQYGLGYDAGFAGRIAALMAAVHRNAAVRGLVELEEEAAESL